MIQSYVNLVAKLQNILQGGSDMTDFNTKDHGVGSTENGGSQNQGGNSNTGGDNLGQN